MVVSEAQEARQSRSADAAGAIQAVVNHSGPSTVFDAGRFVYLQFYAPSLKVLAE